MRTHRLVSAVLGSLLVLSACGAGDQAQPDTALITGLQAGAAANRTAGQRGSGRGGPRPEAAPTAEPATATAAPLADGRVAVTFSGGYVTDPRDHGWPVALIAAALGVPEEVFRDAFSHVTPAGAGEEPSGEQVRQNKAALLSALAPYGVTNERLDAVSDYYRYNASAGELWRHTPAAATALVSAGVVSDLRLTNPGAGYTSLPTITIAGHPLRANVSLAFGTDVASNGGLATLTLDGAK